MKIMEKKFKHLAILILFPILTLFVVGHANSQTCLQPPSGLIGWLPGDGNPNDIVGSNQATMVGGATFAPGLVGQAFYLDGIDDWVMIPDSSSLNFGTNDFTVDMWVNFLSPGTPENQEIIIEKYVETIAHKTGIPREGWSLTKTISALPGYTLRLCGPLWSGSASIIDASVSSISANTWYHVAVTRSGNTFTIYWNGIPIGSGGADVNLNTAASLKIGKRGTPDDTPGSQFPAGLNLNGLVDEVEFFNRALSASEIAAIFNASSAGKCKPAIMVEIDIKPGSYPNSINLASAGVIPVAILSSPSFDATQVDPETVSLAGATVKLIGKGDKYSCSAQYVNDDGLLDLVCHVVTAQFMIEPGSSIATLEANTFGGQAIRGEDSIQIVDQ